MIKVLNIKTVLLLIGVLLLFSTSVIAQEEERKTFINVKARKAKTFHRNAPVNFYPNAPDLPKLIDQTPEISYSFQVQVLRKTCARNNFGFLLEFTQFKFSENRETDLSNPFITRITRNSNFSYLGFGFLHKWNIIPLGASAVFLNNSLTYDVSSERLNIGPHNRLSTEISLELKIDTGIRLKPILGIYYRTALTNYSSQTIYYPYAYGISIGTSF